METHDLISGVGYLSKKIESLAEDAVKNVMELLLLGSVFAWRSQMWHKFARPCLLIFLCSCNCCCCVRVQLRKYHGSMEIFLLYCSVSVCLYCRI